MSEVLQNQNACVGADVFCEFLEIAIHCILFTRGLYPPGVFEKRKKYNVPVNMCIHPDVVSYLTNIIDSVHLLLRENAVDKVMVVMTTPDNKPAERFVFEVAKPSQNMGEDKFLYRIEESLRSFLLKLNVTESLMKPLPADSTWCVQISTKESAAQSINQTQMDKNFPWIEADERETIIEDPKIIPLKAVNSDYIQHAIAKKKKTSRQQSLELDFIQNILEEQLL